jgi:hypothetical protein
MTPDPKWLDIKLSPSRLRKLLPKRTRIFSHQPPQPLKLTLAMLAFPCLDAFLTRPMARKEALALSPEDKAARQRA